MPNVPTRPLTWPPMPFCPDSVFNFPGMLNDVNTSVLAVTATSGTVALNLNGAPQVEFYNAGSFDCAVCFVNVSTGVAVFPSGSSGNYIIGAGQCKIVTIPPTYYDLVKFVAAICGGTNTTTLYISAGIGAS